MSSSKESISPKLSRGPSIKRAQATRRHMNYSVKQDIGSGSPRWNFCGNQYKYIIILFLYFILNGYFFETQFNSIFIFT